MTARKRPRVVVLDHGLGNVHSVAKALERAGADVSLTAERQSVAECDGLLVPGVGSMSGVMAGIDAIRGGEMIGRRLAGSRPVLGVCVGLQVMFEASEESGDGVPVQGLGEWPGTVRRLNAPILPHIGWAEVEPPSDSVLFQGIADERFYFVHSYAATEWLVDPHSRIRSAGLTWAEHGDRFLAAVENGPLAATQFHPEKSGDAGLRLLGNWIASL